MFSQFVTLFLTPVFYIYMEQAKDWSTRIFGKRRRVAPEVVPTAGPVGGGSNRSAHGRASRNRR